MCQQLGMLILFGCLFFLFPACEDEEAITPVLPCEVIAEELQEFISTRPITLTRIDSDGQPIDSANGQPTIEGCILIFNSVRYNLTYLVSFEREDDMLILNFI